MLKYFILVFIILNSVSVSLWAIFVPIKYDYQFLNIVGVQKNTQEKLFFEIQRGTPLVKVFKKLQEKGIIRLYFPYHFFYKKMIFKAGEYEISSSLSPYDIFKKFIKGDVTIYEVTLPEGINMFEIASILDSKGLVSKENFLKISQDSQFIYSLLKENIESLEGYLYPNTYSFIKGMSAKQIIKIMVNEFLKNYKNLEKSVNINLSRHEVVILASLVEKETGVHWERPKISSVFHNRLNKGMKFQSDPTIIYGILKRTGEIPFNITKKDILTKDEYNTYRIEGYPKGPISNPGYQSLQAVHKPEKTSYLFFVSKNNGTHIFSENYEDHKTAVNFYQKKIQPKKNKTQGGEKSFTEKPVRPPTKQ